MALVLIPPIGLDGDCWQWLRLPGVPVVRYVAPGFGRRPPSASPLSLDDLADEVATLDLPAPFDVVGVSMGSMVAQHLAVRHPGVVNSLVLACTGPSADPATSAGRATEVERTGMRGVLATTLARWFTPEALAVEPTHPGVRYAERALLDLRPEAFASGWRAIARHDVVAALGQVDVPATCVAGSTDVSAPPERVRRLAEAIPGADFVVVPGPHMLPLEQPTAFSEIIAAHLARHGCRDGDH